MEKLVGNQRKILKIIYNSTKNSKNFQCYPKISASSILKHFPNDLVTYDDLEYLRDIGLIEIGSYQKVALTSKGRSYFKSRQLYWIEAIITSIFCPIVVAFFTTLITLWLKDSL